MHAERGRIKIPKKDEKLRLPYPYYFLPDDKHPLVANLLRHRMKLKKEIGTLGRIAKRMKQPVIYEKVHHPIIKKFNTQKLQENWARINERIKPIYAEYSVVENQLENLKRLSLKYKRITKH